MGRNVKRILVAAALGALGAMAGPAAAMRPADADAEGRAVAELASTRYDYSTSEDVTVTFTIENRGARPIDVYTWETPFSGVENNLFIVSRDGVPVAYLGIVAKRLPPGPDDFTRIAPGRSRSVDVELTALYDMSQPGNYTVAYRSGMTGSEPLLPSRRGVESNEVNIRLNGEARSSPLQGGKPGTGGGNYPNCSATQITTVDQAKAGATNYASGAASSNFASSTTRYTTWFGAWNSTRSTTVKNHFAAISHAFDTANIVVNCGCKQNYYAYVYPNKPYEIFVCKVFWTAPLTGTDSKSGTLIHEMSHFDVVAGTDDIVYGQAGCKNLANTNPDQAIQNADSHEYYAENQ